MSEAGPLNVSVLGGRGMLGSELTASPGGAGIRCYDLPEWDIRRAVDRERAVADADAVVNCAAYTNVDRAEREPAAAREVNANAVRELARLTASKGCYLLHVSTDFVFDGRQTTPYDEEVVPCPLNVYGQTKLEGEEAVRREGGSWAVLRIQWTYGAAGNNFVRKLAARASKEGVVRMVTDQRGAPTWTRDVVEAIRVLLARRAQGVFHYAAAGCATRFEIARFILERLGIHCDLNPCRSSDFPMSAPRPFNSCFDCGKIDAILPKPRPHWSESLAAFIARERQVLLDLKR
ncbi:MAG: dTDP-4-dehydrorhamnose reductase [Kiritimatiellaeota bacterium]|nr:dTDP-4-dehydrorhamnose reductase [Kiritimatiellota bacterium]